MRTVRLVGAKRGHVPNGGRLRVGLAAEVRVYLDGLGVPVGAQGDALPDLLRSVEYAALEAALRCTGGHNTRAAEVLGVSRRHFQQRLAVHSLHDLARRLRRQARAQSVGSEPGLDAGA